MSSSTVPIKEFRLDLRDLTYTGHDLFGGPDLRTAYIGSLGMNRLPTFQSPVPGRPMRHWK